MTDAYRQFSGLMESGKYLGAAGLG